MQFNNIYQDMPVLVTGHTGFKGAWLAIWLRQLGANVIGLSLPEPPTQPSLFDVSGLGERLVDIRGDIRDYQTVLDAMQQHQPVVVFHLAAQPIVLSSYDRPRETFDSNVTGTVNVLEAVRAVESVRSVVCITTDKVYENRNWAWGYRENDQLGGYDPYSASKAMAELAIASYRRSFFSGQDAARAGVTVASTRAGNVIGGGDFADYRLLPDCMTALMNGEPIRVRNPHSVRPWQHVLEPLSGYLWLACKLIADDGDRFADAWNFGPPERHGVTTRAVVEKVIELWGGGRWEQPGSGSARVETAQFTINWDKAAKSLGWSPVYGWQEALSETVDWFRHYATHRDAPGQPATPLYDVCVEQIGRYAESALRGQLPWVA